ncbi:MAG TPA: YcxB family protein [Pyrinomonadaceae bacterium]|nr:YcxB family protein [Pyrinomonadaceae bacterium]
MSESAVKIEYQLSESEYLAATRLFFFQSREAIIRMGVICMLALMSAFLMNIVVADMSMLLVLLAVVIVFDIFLFYNALVTLPRQYYRGDPKFREKYDLTFSGEGVFVKTFHIDSKLAWSLYTKVIEGRDMYLLLYGKDTRMMTTVPKRAFKSSDEEMQFRALVTRHITDSSGFKNIPPEEREYTPKSLTPPDWR